MSPVCCADCKKPLDRIPLWLETVNVIFVCEDCRQKHRAPVKARAMMDLPPVDGDDEVVVVPDVEQETTVSLEALAEKENREAEAEDDEESEVDIPEVDLDPVLADDDDSILSDEI